MTITQAGPLPVEFVSRSVRRYFSVHVEARSSSGAIFVRDAVIEFRKGRTQEFGFRRWYRGSARSTDNGLDLPSGDLPPC